MFIFFNIFTDQGVAAEVTANQALKGIRNRDHVRVLAADRTAAHVVAVDLTRPTIVVDLNVQERRKLPAHRRVDQDLAATVDRILIKYLIFHIYSFNKDEVT